KSAEENERDEELGGDTEAECAAPVREDKKRSGSHKDDKEEEAGTKLMEEEEEEQGMNRRMAEKSVEAEETGGSDPEVNGTKGGEAKAVDVEMPVRGSTPASSAEHGNAERVEQAKVQHEARGQLGMPQRDGTAMETNGTEKRGEHRDDARRLPAAAGKGNEKAGDEETGNADAETAAADGGTGTGEASMIDLGATKDETDAASGPESQQEETGGTEEAE
uniref:Uncharacterized protein n=1 Tax=Petromyzon marinus TaxID=7757 RepID=S4RU91_PETMA